MTKKISTAFQAALAMIAVGLVVSLVAAPVGAELGFYPWTVIGVAWVVILALAIPAYLIVAVRERTKDRGSSSRIEQHRTATTVLDPTATPTRMCLRCGSLTERRDSRCTRCLSVVPEEETALYENNRLCPHCNSFTARHDRVCIHCGHEADYEETRAVTERMHVGYRDHLKAQWRECSHCGHLTDRYKGQCKHCRDKSAE